MSQISSQRHSTQNHAGLRIGNRKVPPAMAIADRNNINKAIVALNKAKGEMDLTAMQAQLSEAFRITRNTIRSYLD